MSSQIFFKFSVSLICLIAGGNSVLAQEISFPSNNKIAQTKVDMTKSFGIISGTASYLNRMALPPNASLQVRLENLSTPVPRLSVEVTTPIGSKQVPIPFQIPFNQTDIDPAVRYAVRASVLVDNQPIYTSKSYSVITGNNPLELEIIMQPSNGKPTAKLSETYWKLTEIFGKAAIAASGKQEPHLILKSDGRLIGSTGCNRAIGSYETQPNQIKFKMGATTLMACAEPFNRQEQSFLKMLNNVSNYKIENETLEFRDGQNALATFKSVYLTR